MRCRNRRHERRCAQRMVLLAGAALGLWQDAAPVRADIADYAVLRFLYLKTPCGFAAITEKSTDGSGALVFRARCRNETAFPDGARVFCADPDDDRSCQLMEQPAAFHSLDLMRPDMREKKSTSD